MNLKLIIIFFILSLINLRADDKNIQERSVIMSELLTYSGIKETMINNDSLSGVENGITAIDKSTGKDIRVQMFQSKTKTSDLDVTVLMVEFSVTSSGILVYQKNRLIERLKRGSPIGFDIINDLSDEDRIFACVYFYQDVSEIKKEVFKTLVNDLIKFVDSQENNIDRMVQEYKAQAFGLASKLNDDSVGKIDTENFNKYKSLSKKFSIDIPLTSNP